jgi:hypothetical protein
VGPRRAGRQVTDQALEAFVKELGAENAGLCVITSRIAVTDLEALTGDSVRSKDLDHLSPEAGADLLRARGANGTAEELRDAAAEYGGHSLSLTLLGTYLRKAHRGDIRQRERLPAIEGVAAQRMIARYEAWFAGKPELAILHMLALFDRPARKDDIAAVRANPSVTGLTDALESVTSVRWNEAVTTLRDVGLLAAAGEEGDERLDAHPLVREHFAEQLRIGRPAAWREGHRRLYEHLKGVATELPETVEEMAPLHAAVLHGCIAGQPQAVLDEVYRTRIQRGNAFFHTRQLGAVGAETAMLASFFDVPWHSLRPGLDTVAQRWVLTEAAFNLRASGRFAESSDLFVRALEDCFTGEDWRGASINAGCLTELEMGRGLLTSALSRSTRAIGLAHRSKDYYQQMMNTAHRASVLHALGDPEAKAMFIAAEELQKRNHRKFPLLFSMQGCRYCDLLLDENCHQDVMERAFTTLSWAEQNRSSLFSVAVDHLSLGRAHLRAATSEKGGDLEKAANHLALAVDGLRRSGQRDEIPLGLLARADLHIHTRNFELARKDLDETFSLAIRCGFRLHEIDARLGYVQLHLAQGQLATAQSHIAKARALIKATGYHRRDRNITRLETEAAVMAKNMPKRPVICSPGPLAPPIPGPAATFPPTDFTFPPPVVEAYRSGKLMIFFGSGLSVGVPGNFPTWGELPHRFLDQVAALGNWDSARVAAKRTSFGHGLPLEEMLAELDVLRAALKGLRKYQASLNAIFRPADARPGEVHHALVALGVVVLVTTNYDQVLEHAEGPPYRSAYTWKDADKALSDIREGRKVLFKVHGSAENEGSVVMTRREYDEVAKDESYKRIMSQMLQDFTVLLLGYGINDPLDLDLVFELNAGAFGVASRTHYALMQKDAAAPHRDRWAREMNVQVLTYGNHMELPGILRALGRTKANSQ